MVLRRSGEALKEVSLWDYRPSFSPTGNRCLFRSKGRHSALATRRAIWQKARGFANGLQKACGTRRLSPPLPDNPAACCCSSEVEHSLGKGEVESSILSSSTINSQEPQILAETAKLLIRRMHRFGETPVVSVFDSFDILRTEF